MDDNRRPIKTRSAGWAKHITDILVKRDISPNQISVASIAFALAGVVALNIDSGVIGSICCAIGIQLRLLCNLFDGMVAIEGGKKSDIGSLYNEFPDRIADSLLDTVSANTAAGIRDRIGVSVADSHIGAVIQSASTGQITVVTSDPGDMRRMAGDKNIIVAAI